MTRKIDLMKGHVTAIALSPDGKLVALAYTDRTVKLWDLTTGPLVWC